VRRGASAARRGPCLAVFAEAAVAKYTQIAVTAIVAWPVATRHRELRFVRLGLRRAALVVGPLVPLVGEFALEASGPGLGFVGELSHALKVSGSRVLVVGLEQVVYPVPEASEGPFVGVVVAADVIVPLLLEQLLVEGAVSHAA